MPLLVHDHGIIYLIAKNATNSIKRATDGLRVEQIGELQTLAPKYKGLPRVAMWRDPFARIESAYRMFRSGNDTIGTFQEWLGRVLVSDELQSDRHIRPQWRSCVAEDKWLPNRVVRWQFHEFCEVLKLPLIKDVHNASQHWPTEWTEQMRKAYRCVYAKDFEIWHD
jgi:hypothetical protein